MVVILATGSLLQEGNLTAASLRELSITCPMRANANGDDADPTRTTQFHGSRLKFLVSMHCVQPLAAVETCHSLRDAGLGDECLLGHSFSYNVHQMINLARVNINWHLAGSYVDSTAICFPVGGSTPADPSLY